MDYTEAPLMAASHEGARFDEFEASQDVPDDILAQGLQQMMTETSMPPDCIAWIRVKMHDAINDTSHFADLVMQKTRDRYPAMIDLIQGLDFRSIILASALEELSRRCACCDTPISEYTGWKHLLTHLPEHFQQVSMYDFGDLMGQFCAAYLPLVDALYDMSSLKFRIALQQIFVLRSILLTRDGCGPGKAFRTEGNLGLSSGKRRRLAGHETSQETTRAIQCRQEAVRSNGAADHTADSIGPQARGSAQSNQHGDGVHSTPGNGQGLHHSYFDESLTDLACRQPEDHFPENDFELVDDGYSLAEDATPDGSQERQPLLSVCSEREPLDNRGKDALPSMGPSTATTDSFQGGPFASRRRDDDVAGGAEHDGRSIDYHQISLSEEAQGSRGCQHQDTSVVAGLFKSGSSRDVANLEETMLSLMLAAYPCQSSQLHPNKESTGGTDLQTIEVRDGSSMTIPSPKWKVIRIMQNPGVLCYANCIFQSLCWMALHSGHTESSCWSDGGAIFNLMTKLDKAAVSIPFHEVFLALMTHWFVNHAVRQQHDATEFLQHVLKWLKPGCWNAEWIPRWYLGVVAQAETEIEKGGRWDPLTFKVGCFPDDTPLQFLIEHWHDSEGQQFGLKDGGHGLSIQLERMIAPDYTRKPLMKPLFPEDLILHLPCITETALVWKPFQICGVIFHKGANYHSGHFFSSFYCCNKRRWLHYDDGKIPLITQTLEDEDLLRLTHMIWITPMK